jgi:hypothetical protein
MLFLLPAKPITFVDGPEHDATISEQRQQHPDTA